MFPDRSNILMFVGKRILKIPQSQDEEVENRENPDLSPQTVNVFPKVNSYMKSLHHRAGIKKERFF